jgi:hypothetical protein
MSDIDELRALIDLIDLPQACRDAHRALDLIAANWLDLNAVPEGWELAEISESFAGWDAMLVNDEGTLTATDSTPAAALAAACERAREG